MHIDSTYCTVDFWEVTSRLCYDHFLGRKLREYKQKANNSEISDGIVMVYVCDAPSA